MAAGWSLLTPSHLSPSSLARGKDPAPSPRLGFCTAMVLAAILLAERAEIKPPLLCASLPSPASPIATPKQPGSPLTSGHAAAHLAPG